MSLSMVLFIVFLVLKLCGVIAWSWWLVTLPLWFGFALVACGICGIAFAFVAAAFVRATTPRRKIHKRW